MSRLAPFWQSRAERHIVRPAGFAKLLSLCTASPSIASPVRSSPVRSANYEQANYERANDNIGSNAFRTPHGAGSKEGQIFL